MKPAYLSLPILKWARRYTREDLASDVVAAVIVAIMLIPQSLAYALLAGLPAEVGLYASIAPLLAYAVLGTSRTLSVGPVAITSLMTAAALAEVAQQGTADYLSAATTLAFLSGLMLFACGALRLGIVANFLSHSVVSAFITASAIIIALSQLRHLLGIEAGGDTVLELITELEEGLAETNFVTFAIGGGVVLFLFAVRWWGSATLQGLGLKAGSANLLTKTAPVFGVIFTIVLVGQLDLTSRGVDVVGAIPTGLPMPTLPGISLELIEQLWVPAALISLIGYVESISVGRTLGARRRERVSNDQELIGLGAANVAASVSGGFPVTGGFSRSVVNFDAGARTQAASIFSALLIALVAILLTPYLYNLPKATLAATIVVAVLSLVDFSILGKTWRFAKGDYFAVLLTLVMTLAFGVEIGVSSGVFLSLGLHLYRTAKPHVAEVGLVEGSQHFRNVRRYKVDTDPTILNLRVDESLFFANAALLEDVIYQRIFADSRIAHVVLMCAAVNEVDYSALETLEEINQRLYEEGVQLHLSEVKGPVLDKLERVHFLDELSGNLYMTQYQAYTDLSGQAAS